MDKDYGAIVTQPNDFSGCNVKPESNVNVANGLNSILEGLSEIVIHQHVDAVEVCMGWERNNRYSIFNEKKEQILYLYEGGHVVFPAMRSKMKQEIYALSYMVIFAIYDVVAVYTSGFAMFKERLYPTSKVYLEVVIVLLVPLMNTSSLILQNFQPQTKSE